MHPKIANSMDVTCLSLAIERPWLALGRPFSPLLEWTQKTVFQPCRASVKFFSWSTQVVFSREL